MESGQEQEQESGGVTRRAHKRRCWHAARQTHGLGGRQPEEAAVVEMWTRRAEMLVANPFMLGVRHTHPALAALEAPNPPVGEYNKEIGLKGLKVLDRRLGESEWLAGER